MLRSSPAASATRVTVETTDGDVISWARGEGLNRYTLNGKVYDKPGRSVPEAIRLALNVTELDFDGETVRVQWAPQMDAPFLISDSGAKATRMLGVAGNAAIVSAAHRLAQTNASSESDLLRAATLNLENLRQSLAGYSDLEAADAIATDLRASLSRLRAHQDRIARVQAAVTSHAALQSRVSSVRAESARHAALADALSLLHGVQAKRVALEGYLSVLERRADIEPQLERSARTADLIGRLRSANDMRTATERFIQLQSKQLATRQALEAAEEERLTLSDALALLIEANTCPVCGSVKS